MVRIIPLQCDLPELFDGDIPLFNRLLQLNRRIVRMIHFIYDSIQEVSDSTFITSDTQKLNYGLFSRIHF